MDKTAWFNKAVAYFHLQRYDEAVDSFNTALEIDPEYHAAKEKREEAMDFLKHRNVERYARDILAFDYKHRRTPTREEAFRDCAVPVEQRDMAGVEVRVDVAGAHLCQQQVLGRLHPLFP